MQAFAEELETAASKEVGLRFFLCRRISAAGLEGLHDEKYDAAFTFMVPDSLNEESYFFSDRLTC